MGFICKHITYMGFQKLVEIFLIFAYLPYISQNSKTCEVNVYKAEVYIFQQTTKHQRCSFQLILNYIA